MADEKPLDVIAVGAHPDDVEIACGGTLAKLVKQGYRVGIVDLTDGEPTPNSPGPEARAAEAEAARKKLGVHVRVQLDLPNRRLFDTFEARVALAKVFRGAQVDEARVQRVQTAVRQRVLGLFEWRGLLSSETVGVMQGWGHRGGFSVHAGRSAG